MPLLEYVLGGIKRTQAKAETPPKPRLSITPEILAYLQKKWVLDSPSRNAAACTELLGFLGAGEFTVLSVSAYDGNVHLSLSDLATDSHIRPSDFGVRMKQSKTDPLCKGADVYLGATEIPICPVQAIKAYLEKHGPSRTPVPL